MYLLMRFILKEKKTKKKKRMRRELTLLNLEVAAFASRESEWLEVLHQGKF